MTEQRRVILEELRSVHSHPTADDLYAMVRRRIPNISLGTVYRNLEVLSEAGLIQKLEMSGSQKRFDGVVENHYHIRCVKCNRVDDLEMEAIPGLDRVRTDTRGYRILSHRLEFLGVCPRCSGESLEADGEYEADAEGPERPRTGAGRSLAEIDVMRDNSDDSRAREGGIFSNGGSEGFKN